MKNTENSSELFRVTPFKYGILPPVGDENNFDVNLEMETPELLKITIKRLRAVTLAETYISLPIEDKEPLVIVTPFRKIKDRESYSVVLEALPESGHPQVDTIQGNGIIWTAAKKFAIRINEYDHFEINPSSYNPNSIYLGFISGDLNNIRKYSTVCTVSTCPDLTRIAKEIEEEVITDIFDAVKLHFTTKDGQDDFGKTLDEILVACQPSRITDILKATPKEVYDRWQCIIKKLSHVYREKGETEGRLVNFPNDILRFRGHEFSQLKARADFMKTQLKLMELLGFIKRGGRNTGLFVRDDTDKASGTKPRRPSLIGMASTEIKPEVPPHPSMPGIPEQTEVWLGASAPKAIRPGGEFTLKFVAYEEHMETKVRGILDQMSDNATHHMGAGLCKWQHGTNVKVKCYGKRLKMEPDEQSFTWNGNYNILYFDISVDDGPVDSDSIVKIDVMISEIVVARMRFDLKIRVNIGAAENGEADFIKTSPIKTAFASYASEDRSRVLDRIAEINKNGVEVFLDHLSLKPGDLWKEVLEKEIRNREGFLLFWSAAARVSEWVDWEWRTALNLKGLEGIDLHPLSTVDEAPPPDDLKDLHFNDIYMIARKNG